MKKHGSGILALVMAGVLLTGCGAQDRELKASAGTAADMEYGYATAPSETEEVYWDTNGAAEGTGSVMPADAKMVYRANINLETTEYDAAEQALGQLVESCGGYYENRSLSNRSSGYRFSSFTVRVPAQQFQAFCDQVGQLCRVSYMSASADNITQTYYDTDSRLKTARIKLERLQNLLEQAANMEDIITIEQAISETEYEIEELSGTLRRYDGLVDYATVEIDLSEVYRLSGTDTVPMTFGERVVSALGDGLRSAGQFLEELVIALAGAWVFLLVLGAALFAVVRMVRRKLARRKQRKNITQDGE